MATHHRDLGLAGARGPGRVFVLLVPGVRKGLPQPPPLPPATYLCALLLQHPHLLLSSTQGSHLWDFTCCHTSLRRNTEGPSAEPQVTILSPTQCPSKAAHPWDPALCLLPLYPPTHQDTDTRPIYDWVPSGSPWRSLFPLPDPQGLPDLSLSLPRPSMATSFPAQALPLRHCQLPSPPLPISQKCSSLEGKSYTFFLTFYKMFIFKMFFKRYTNKGMCACVISTCIS